MLLLFVLSLSPAPALAEVTVRSLMTEDQGILPNSGPVEVFGINLVQPIKFQDLGCADPGVILITFLDVRYETDDPNEEWVISFSHEETSEDGPKATPGTLRFAVERHNRLTDETARKPNLLYNPEPLSPTYDPFPYLDIRIGPQPGESAEYVWNFEIPQVRPVGTPPDNIGIFRVKLKLCVENPGASGDCFYVDMADPKVQFLNSLTISIRNIRDRVEEPDIDVQPSDFFSFSLYKDSPGTTGNGVFEWGVDEWIVDGVIEVQTDELFDVTFGDVTLPTILADLNVFTNDFYGNAGDDYFVTVWTSETIDSDCSTCTREDNVDDFTAIALPNSMLFDGGSYQAPIICFDEAVGGERIACESLALDILPSGQYPFYLCYYFDDVRFPGHNMDFPAGKQRYQYLAPDLLVRQKYRGEFKLLSGITEDSFDWIFKDPDDETAYFEVPEVTPTERRFAVLGLDVAGGTANNPEYLDGITLTLSNTGNDFEFDPTEHLDDFRLNYPYFSGVTLYEDTNDNGRWDEVSFDPETFQPILDTGDMPLDMLMLPTISTVDYSEFKITFWTVDPPEIDLLADRQPDYFVVLRDDSGLLDDSPFFRDGKGINIGANFRTSLQVVDPGPGIPDPVSFRRAQPGFGLTSSAVKESFSMVAGQDYSLFFGYDVNPLGFPDPSQAPIVHMIDATSSPIPILAFNAACSDVPQTGLVNDPIHFESIRLEFDGAGTGFEEDHIEEILIFRDDKSPYFDFPERNVGAYDFMNDVANWMPPGRDLDYVTNPSEESPIPLNPYAITFDDVSGNYVVTLSPREAMQFYSRDKVEGETSIDNYMDNYIINEEGLPDNVVFPGSDYFICIKTSDQIAYRDIIRPILPIGSVVASTGPTVVKTDDFTDPEEHDAMVREMVANVPVILEDLVLKHRGLNPTLSANETDVPVIGINTFTNSPLNGEQVFLEQLVVQFIEAASRLSPNLNLGENGDLLSYQDVNGGDTQYSGIKVYRRINGQQGQQDVLINFAETDHVPYTFLDNPSLVASTDAQNQAILMVFNPDDPEVRELLRIPENDSGDYAGNDFIIKISTSPHFDRLQDNFSVAIISWGPDSPNTPRPYQVLNGPVAGYPPIPLAFQFASSSALLFYQNYPGTTRGIGFVDDNVDINGNGVHSRSFESINTVSFNASEATRLNAVGNFSATLSDPRVVDRTHQVVLIWDDTNSDGPGTFNESGYWIESDMFGTFQPIPHDPIPPETEELFINGPRFLVGRTVNFRIYAFQEDLNPEAKYPPMNGIGPVATTSITFAESIVPIPPTADFVAAPLQGCAPLTVEFTDKSLNNPISWQWDFGDGGTSIQPESTYTYEQCGVYTVSLTVANDGGSDTETKQELITVLDVPVADFVAARTQVCVGQEVRFTDLTSCSPEEWSWDFGDGLTSPEQDEQNPVYVYNAPGTYTVTLNASTTCGPDPDGETKGDYITVTEGLVAEFSAENAVGCTPLTVQFYNESLCDPTSCIWDFGDGSAPFIDPSCGDPVHVYGERGVYTVTLTVCKDGDCALPMIKENLVTAAGILPAFSVTPTQGCAPLEVCFVDETQCNPTSWDWDFGDGSTGPERFEQNPCHTYTEAETYPVTLTASNSVSSETTPPQNITVGATPVADFEIVGGRTEICLGEELCFNDLSTENTDEWFWDFGDGFTSNEQNPCHVFDQEGLHTVCLTAENECGDDVECKEVLVQSIVASLSASVTEGCAPLDVDFTDLSSCNPVEWSWDFGDGTTYEGQNPPTHTYNDAGTYTVTLTVTNAVGDTDETTVDIVVNPVAVADFTATPMSGLTPLVVTFTDQSTGNPTSWHWDFGDGTTYDGQNPPPHTYQAGTYTACLTVNNDHGCSDQPHCETILVDSLPTLSVSTTVLSNSCMHATNASPQSFQSWNSGGGTLSYSIAPNKSWLTVTPKNGTSTGEHDAITVNYSTSGLAAGTHLAKINITSNGGSAQISVTLTVVDELTQIHLTEPSNNSTLSSPPTFVWMPNGGTSNEFSVELSYSSSFGSYWSTYKNLQTVIQGTSWTMDASLWNQVAQGRPVYWRVRGRDASKTPMTIVTSSETWSFTKP